MMSRSMTTYLHISTVLTTLVMRSICAEAWTTIPLLSTQKSQLTWQHTFLNFKANSAGHEDLPIYQNMFPTTVNQVDGVPTTMDVIKRKYVVDFHADSTNTAKSDVYKAQQKCQDTGEPVGDHVVIKLSLNHQGMKRESDAYNLLASDLFVEKHEFYEPTQEGDASVIVMESGEEDLTKYILNNGPLNLEDVREKTRKLVEVVTFLHEKDVVWCDMKTCNFVVLKSDEVKGIDLEAATFVGTGNYMHTASGAPPEYAIEHIAGRNMPMQFSFDIWSLGMALYHFAVGEHYFTPLFELSDETQIFTYLSNVKQLDFAKLHSTNVDPGLKEVIMHCLAVDPNMRPNIQQIKEHPFFSIQQPAELPTELVPPESLPTDLLKMHPEIKEHDSQDEISITSTTTKDENRHKIAGFLLTAGFLTVIMSSSSII